MKRTANPMVRPTPALLASDIKAATTEELADTLPPSTTGDHIAGADARPPNAPDIEVDVGTAFAIEFAAALRPVILDMATRGGRMRGLSLAQCRELMVEVLNAQATALRGSKAGP